MADESGSRGTALITGAAGQLGSATADRLAADGFTVAMLDRPTTFDDNGIEPGPGRHRYDFDLHEVEAYPDLVARVEADLGPLTALVNNAAIYPTNAFLDVPVEEYDDVITINQRAYFFMAQAAAKAMAGRAGADTTDSTGAIVNISSITWHGILPDLSVYVSTKGAAVAATRAMARELGSYGIRVNSIAPGAFPTKAEEIHADPEQYSQWVIDQQALKRRGTPAELAAVVSFLVGPDSVFVTGQTLQVDGGWVMV